MSEGAEASEKKNKEQDGLSKGRRFEPPRLFRDHENERERKKRRAEEKTCSALLLDKNEMKKRKLHLYRVFRLIVLERENLEASLHSQKLDH